MKLLFVEVRSRTVPDVKVPRPMAAANWMLYSPDCLCKIRSADYSIEGKGNSHIGSTAPGVGSLVRVLLVLQLARFVGDEREDACHLDRGIDAVLGHPVDQKRRRFRGSRALVSSVTARRRARHDGLDDLDSRHGSVVEGPSWCKVGTLGEWGSVPYAGEGEGDSEGPELHFCGYDRVVV